MLEAPADTFPDKTAWTLTSESVSIIRGLSTRGLNDGSTADTVPSTTRSELLIRSVMLVGLLKVSSVTVDVPQDGAVLPISGRLVCPYPEVIVDKNRARVRCVTVFILIPLAGKDRRSISSEYNGQQCSLTIPRCSPLFKHP
jgi:hypothetical protein